MYILRTLKLIKHTRNTIGHDIYLSYEMINKILIFSPPTKEQMTEQVGFFFQ